MADERNEASAVVRSDSNSTVANLLSISVVAGLGTISAAGVLALSYVGIDRLNNIAERVIA